MQDSAKTAWDQLQNAVAIPQHSSLIELLVYLAVGGVLALYIRFLYRRTSRAPMAADSVARVFPLLTMVTTAVIAVVKASLALSLGLVGALSIVRFRAAIKDPEELVYLFLCIAVGLALGASQPLIAIGLVIVASLFVLLFDRGGGRPTEQAFVTVGGDRQLFLDAEGGPLATLESMCPSLTIERCDLDGERGELRVHVHKLPPGGAAEILAQLRARLPDCEISFVNTETIG